MQISPYRVQLAGIQTAPVDYRPTAREVTLTGIVRDDGLIQCRVFEHDRPFVVTGQAVDVALDDSARQPSARAKVSTLDVDPRESRMSAVIRLEESGRGLPPGTRVFATVRRPVAELEPFRSLPSNPPALIKGDLLAIYVCPQHPEVLATEARALPCRPQQRAATPSPCLRISASVGGARCTRTSRPSTPKRRARPAAA